MAVVIEMEEAGIRAVADNMRFVAKAETIVSPPNTSLASRRIGSRNRWCPGRHIRLFMGKKTLETAWPKIGRWIAAIDHSEEHRP